MNKRIKQFYQMRINVDELFYGEYMTRFLKSFYSDSSGKTKSISSWNDFYHKENFYSYSNLQNDCIYGPYQILDPD